MRPGGARLEGDGCGAAPPEAGASASAPSAAARSVAQLSACWRVHNSTRSSPESAPAGSSPDSASSAAAPPPPPAAGPPRRSSAKEAARAPSCSTAAAAAAAGEESPSWGDATAPEAPPRCSASIASTRHAHTTPSSVPSANAQGPALRSRDDGWPRRPPCSRRSLSRLLSNGSDDSEGERPGRLGAEGRGRCMACHRCDAMRSRSVADCSPPGAQQRSWKAPPDGRVWSCELVQRGAPLLWSPRLVLVPREMRNHCPRHPPSVRITSRPYLPASRPVAG